MHGMCYWKVGYRLKFCESNYFLNAQRVECLICKFFANLEFKP